MVKAADKPEQDPAEGSREVIERELAKRDEASHSEIGQGHRRAGEAEAERKDEASDRN